MPTELYRKHRPNSLKAVLGQTDAIKVLKGFGEVIPHALMFVGPSGTGKTTLARITAFELLGCHRDDLKEINTASVESPLGMVQQVQQEMAYHPLGGKVRVYILDEVQSLSRARFAQEGLLKVLEECPDHVHFMLCTTDPAKIIATVKNRCTPVPLKAVAAGDISKLVTTVVGLEKAKIGEAVIARITEVAEGSPRKALVELDKVIGLDDDAARLAAVGVGTGAEKAAFDLIKVLMPFQGRPSWKSVAAVLKAIEAEDPESVRQLLLACARTGLLKDDARSGLCWTVIDVFREPLWDRNSGKALLAARSYEVVQMFNKQK